MQPLRSESATLPRDFRFHYQDGQGPTTPEPSSTVDLTQPPPPPKASKLRIKRRNVTDIGFAAPTEQFLASVAAADVPIPTIEEPQILDDQSMLDREYSNQLDTEFLAPQIPNYRNSPPKTPIPQFDTSMEGPPNYRPDWSMSMASTPDDSYTRPSSAMSNPSDYSDDSYFSSIRTSRPSEDGSCTSPESEMADPFVFPIISKGKENALEVTSGLEQNPNVLNGQLRTKTRRDAFWTKDLSDHLWQTYQIYLQDPTVTPFRLGASSIPPEGVIHRVAREAKRSWKGPKAVSDYEKAHPRQKSHINVDSSTRHILDSPGSAATSNSGSITPTAETIPKTYLQWQHSSAATRNHLRELCKRKAAASIQAQRFFQSRSPTPFTQDRARPYHRPSQSASFSTRDIAFALTTSTSDSMRPDGPLAALAVPRALPNLQPFSHAVLEEQRLQEIRESMSQGTRSTRLGSPFSSRTYGPSSSRASISFSRPSQPRTQSDLTPCSVPRLRSPVYFGQSCSLNGTQKRRAQDALEEEVELRTEPFRPTILDERLFGIPMPDSQRRVRSRGFSLGDAASRARLPGLFMPPNPSTDATEVGPSSVSATPSLLPSVTFGFPDKGTASSMSGTSNTFPRRLFQPIDEASTIRKRPFATVHHTRHSINSFDFKDSPSLKSRLTQIDEKLAEIRGREETGRNCSNE